MIVERSITFRSDLCIVFISERLDSLNCVTAGLYVLGVGLFNKFVYLTVRLLHSPVRWGYDVVS